MPPQLVDVTFKQRLNETLPLDAEFTDEHGRAVTLGQYFRGKPVLLARRMVAAAVAQVL